MKLKIDSRIRNQAQKRAKELKVDLLGAEIIDNSTIRIWYNNENKKLDCQIFPLTIE